MSYFPFVSNKIYFRRFSILKLEYNGIMTSFSDDPTTCVLIIEYFI